LSDSPTIFDQTGLHLLGGLFHGDVTLLPEIARRHGALLLVLFGSTATGKRRPDSDVDLAVLFPGPAPEHGWYEREDDLLFDVEDDLQPTCRVQVIALNRAPELLQKEVADYGIVLYADDPDRWLHYRIRAYRNFEDTEKYRRRRWNALLAEYGMLPDATGSRQ
jgi:predicted nucleotidyltransferase